MEQKYVHFLTDNSVMVMDLTTGEQVKFFSDDSRFENAIQMVSNGDYEGVFKLDTKHVITTFFAIDIESDDNSVKVTVEDGEGVVTLSKFNMKVPLHPAITKRILKMNEQGFDAMPLINFISNLYSNPSQTAVNELYLFIEACELPITEDGCFIAYKIVNANYMDCYTGTVDNHIGQTPSMPRHMVDDDRQRTCSQGLHFCSKGYLRYYGSGGSRCMLVKINPADVVAIPADYNNAKGRTWYYEVVGEVSGQWRDWLPTTDYNTKAVVSNVDGSEIVKAKVEAKVDEVDASVTIHEVTEEFKRGYCDGYPDGRNRVPLSDRVTNPTSDEKSYDDGYDLGHNHGRLHRPRAFK